MNKIYKCLFCRSNLEYLEESLEYRCAKHPSHISVLTEHNFLYDIFLDDYIISIENYFSHTKTLKIFDTHITLSNCIFNTQIQEIPNNFVDFIQNILIMQ